MSDPFLAWERNADTEESERVLATQFDWESIEGSSEEIMGTKAEAAELVISEMIRLCAEGITKLDRKDQRAKTVGLRFLCFCSMYRPGQAFEPELHKIAELTGTNHKSVYKVALGLKRKSRMFRAL